MTSHRTSLESHRDDLRDAMTLDPILAKYVPQVMAQEATVGLGGVGSLHAGGISSVHQQLPYRSSSGASSTSQSSSTCFYTTAPADSGGGLYRRLAAETHGGASAFPYYHDQRVLHASNATQSASDAGGGGLGTRGVVGVGKKLAIDLEAYNELKGSFTSRKAYDPYRSILPVAAVGSGMSAPSSSRSLSLTTAADELVSRYQEQLQASRAIPHPQERHRAGTTRSYNPSSGYSPDSIDALRHRTVLQTTVATLFGADRQPGGTNGGGSEGADRQQIGSNAFSSASLMTPSHRQHNHHHHHHPGSPRSWQDDVLRSVAVAEREGPPGLLGYSVGHAVRLKQRPSSHAPVGAPLFPAASASSSFVENRGSEEPFNDGDFADATEDPAAADPTTKTRSGSDGGGALVALADGDGRVGAPRSANHEHLNSSDAATVSSKGGDADTVSGSKARGGLMHPEDHFAAFGINATTAADRALNSAIGDAVLERDIALVHTRIAIVRGIMAKQALEQIESATREEIVTRSMAYFGTAVVHFDELVARQTLTTREQSTREQMIGSHLATIRREGARMRLFADWMNTESVERRRLEHQRELYISAQEGLWKALRRIWEPQHRIVVDEAERRLQLERLHVKLFCEYALAQVELAEELSRRQLLTARDPMLLTRGAFAVRLVLGRHALPESADDEGYFLTSMDDGEALERLASSSTVEISTLPYADLLALRGAPAEYITHAVATAQGGVGRVLSDLHNNSNNTKSDHGSVSSTVNALMLPELSDTTSPLEWSSFFLRSTAPPLRSLESQRAGTARKTPSLPPARVVSAASACAATIAVPAPLWLAWYGDCLLAYVSQRRHLGWTSKRIQDTLWRYLSGSFEADLTLVDYFSYWRPVLRLIFYETRARIVVERDELALRHEQLEWHDRAMHQLRFQHRVRGIVEDYGCVTEALVQAEAVQRGALYGFFVAWKGRLQFIAKLYEVEEVAWEAALQLAKRNAVTRSAGTTPTPLLSAAHRSAHSSSVVSPLESNDASRSASHAPSHALNISGGGGLAGCTTHDVPDLSPQRLDATTGALLAPTSQGLSRLREVGLMDVGPVSPFAKGRTIVPIHHSGGPSSSTDSRRVPESFANESATTMRDLLAARSSGSGTGARPQTLVEELFNLADVTATATVKLANVAAALRLRKICFDLPHIARCFQRAAHLYEEMSGLREVQTLTAGLADGTGAILNREAFALMIQLLFNELRANKQLDTGALERWEYENRRR